MPLRIVLTGSECTGKTTLAAKLADHYKVEFVPEYLRSYFEEKNGILTIEDAIPIAQGQFELERKAEKQNSELVICDTDIISSIVYSKHYFSACPNWLEEQFAKRSPSIYLLCDIDVKWQDDGQRDMEDGREYMQQLFAQELKERGQNVHKISGSLEQRLKTAVQTIDSALKNYC